MGVDYVNLVTVQGVVSHVGEARELPSGDTVHVWRIVVDRPAGSPHRPRGASGGRSTAGDRRQVDVFDVACWTAATRRAAGRLVVGSPVRVEGALRRRFYRAGAGVQSRTEIEAASVRTAAR